MNSSWNVHRTVHRTLPADVLFRATVFSQTVHMTVYYISSLVNDDCFLLIYSLSEPPQLWTLLSICSKNLSLSPAWIFRSNHHYGPSWAKNNGLCYSICAGAIQHILLPALFGTWGSYYVGSADETVQIILLLCKCRVFHRFFSCIASITRSIITTDDNYIKDDKYLTHWLHLADLVNQRGLYKHWMKYCRLVKREQCQLKAFINK